MTKFEEFLIDKGHIMYAFDFKEEKFYKPKGHIISTMVNLYHFYIHNSNIDLIKKIENGENVKNFTENDYEKIIQYGLHEYNKPSTLISPRPRIQVKRFRTYFEEQHKVIETEKNDDSINIVISKINFEEIYKAMYDKSIVFKFDLT
jgi:hypothetical protein